MKWLLAFIFTLLMTGASMSDERFMPYIEWLTANSDLKYNGEPLPDVEYVSQNILQTIVYGPEKVAEAEYKGQSLLEILGAYDDKKNIMYLPEGADIGAWENAPTVVHELFHFLQMVNKVDDYGCIANLEQPAYEAQAAWMDAHNHPEERPNLFFVFMLTQSCQRMHF
jgi:hypothetical protein